MSNQLRRRFAAILWCALGASCLGQGVTGDKPKEPVKVATADDPEQAGRNVVTDTLATSLLKTAYKDHPDGLTPLIDDVHHAIEKECAENPVKRAAARESLCMRLFEAAMPLGLREFESIEADPGAITMRQLTQMRFFAAFAYQRDGRSELAEKQFDRITGDPSASETVLASMWAMRVMTTEDKKAALRFSEQSLAHSAKCDNDGPGLMAMLASLRWCETDAERAEAVRALVTRARVCHDPRLAAIICIPVLDILDKDPNAQAAIIEEATARLRSTPVVDPRERLADLSIIVAACHRVNAQLAAKVAAEAEEFAHKRFAAGSEEVRIARLVHAKALRDVGEKDKLAAYVDLNTDEVLTAGFEIGWTFEGDCPTPHFETFVHKSDDKK